METSQNQSFPGMETSHFLAWKPVISWHLARNQSLWLRNLALGTWYPSGVLSIGCSVCHGYTVPVPAACRSQYHRAAPVSRQKVLRQASFVFCGRWSWTPPRRYRKNQTKITNFMTFWSLLCAKCPGKMSPFPPFLAKRHNWLILALLAIVWLSQP